MQADDAAGHVHLLVIVEAQINHAVGTELGIGNAGLGIEGNELIADGDVKSTLLVAIGPVAQTEARAAA